MFWTVFNPTQPQEAVRRRALAPVLAVITGANALRLMLLAITGANALRLMLLAITGANALRLMLVAITGANALRLMLLLLLVGCGTSTDAPKTSLFEHDHHVAAHWPNDLADLSAKLNARIASVRTGSPVDEDDHHHDHDHDHEHEHEHEHDPVPLRDQIEDLVDWVAEIAADTNLSEADWIPLYEKSVAVSAKLKANSSNLSNEDLHQLESLCELIDETVEKIPEQLPNLVKGES